MRIFALFAVALVAVAADEIVIPGRSLYQMGWFNSALVLILVLLVAQSRQLFRTAHGRVARGGIALITFGVGILAIAAIANGLLAPSPHTIIGAPGSQVHVSALAGSLAFPLATGGGNANSSITLIRSGHGAEVLRDGEYIGASILRMRPRTVAFMRAYDARGASLTITQPSGSVFLSPVLMMQARQKIDGLNLPYDSFAIPALHRLVKAVLFTGAEAAAFDPTRADSHGALLFAVDTDQDRPLPHAISVAASGTAVRVGGATLRGDIFKYPAIEIISAPSMLAVIIGSIAIVLGLFGLVLGRSDIGSLQSRGV